MKVSLVLYITWFNLYDTENIYFTNKPTNKQ